MNFAEKLIAAVKQKGNAVCVGLDPRLKNLPAELRHELDEKDQEQVANAYEAFSKGIIDVVGDLVPIIKPQIAFYELLGPAGLRCLANVIQYAKSKQLLVLLDAKRGDIGSTAEAYAKAYVGNGTQLSSDALTVNPYMGMDTLEPFVETATANQNGLFVLVKTSNPGSGHFQDQQIGDHQKEETLFEKVGHEVNQLANQSAGPSGYGDIGAVVGATYPEQLGMLRKQMPNTLFLIPGYGAQGGGLNDVLPGFDDQGLGAIVNSSRGIIFAYEKEEFPSSSGWQGSVESACQKMAHELSVENIRQSKN